MDEFKQMEFKNAFNSAKSVEETFKLFREMESRLDESELGLPCYYVARRIFRQGNNSEQVLRFGRRALNILTDNYKRTRLVSYSLFANVLRLLGCAYFDLKRFDECVDHLNSAEWNLSKEDDIESYRVMSIALNIQIDLRIVKEAIGKMDESVVHSRKILDIQEKLMEEEGCVELGEANMDVSLAYINAFCFKEALPFCLKALAIYTNKLRHDSVEVAQATRCLAVIYHQMGETYKAFELNQSAITVLKKTTPENPILMKAEIESANMLVDMGKYEEAVGVLKGMVSCDDLSGDLRVKSFTTRARAFCYWGKFDDAEKYMNVIRRMIEEEEMNPTVVAVAFTDLSSLYQKMDNLEKAISLMQKGLASPGLPQKLLTQFCTTLMSLILKEKWDVSYMEYEVEKLKVFFGPEHCVVGYGYSKLGVAYWGSGRKELGANSLANAKDILDATLGPHHLISLKISQGLSVCYAALGRYVQALEIATKVVGGMKYLEPSELQIEFIHEVVTHMSKIKKRIAESSTRAASQSEDE